MDNTYYKSLCLNIESNEHAQDVLKSLTKSFPRHTYNGCQFIGKALENFDGDTVDIVVWVDNEKMFKRFRMRLTGYNAPEIRPLLSNPNRSTIKENAILCKDYLWELVTANDTLLDIICGEYDKYGRLLASITRKCDGLDINSTMNQFVQSLVL